MDGDAMDYEMQYHGSHPHAGALRTEGGCPALARWRRDQQSGNMWQDQRSWSQQSLFPPASSDAFLHPHPPPSFLHWPPSSTTSHGSMSISRPSDSSTETPFDHQIPEFALPPIAHPPYSPLTFVPPLFRPQRNTQIPQGPGDFQHILHSQPSQSPTRGDMERHGHISSDRHSATNPLSPLAIPPPTTSASPAGSLRSASSHVNEQLSPSPASAQNSSHESTGRAEEDRPSPPARQSVPNPQSYARLPPPATGSGSHSSDTTALERAARTLQDPHGSSTASLAASSRGYLSSSTASFGTLGTRARAGSNGGNSETAGSPYSSLDDDSDLDEGNSRWQQNGLRSVRQAQILRGQMSSKKVASQRAILTLQQVDVDTLPDSERTCVICYNDFGIASPEGVSEVPLRLPKCKHVFGNHCILKWLEESDSCPYCRDKLPSENAALSRETFRRMLQLARVEGLPLPRGMQTFRRPLQSLRRDASMPDIFDPNAARQRGSQGHASTPQHRDGTVAAERRSPPEDLNDSQRRQRPRHEPAYAVSTGRGSRPTNILPGLPVTSPDAQQRLGSTTAASQQHSPVRQPFSPSNSHNQQQQQQQQNQANDFWVRRAQTLHTSHQQIGFQRPSSFPHQPQDPAVGSATLAPLPFIQQASPFSNYVPPVNTSASNAIMPRTGNYQNYPNTITGSNLQAPMSAELPSGTAFPGPPPPHSPPFYQQLPQLGQFQGVSYPQSNPAHELGRHGLGIAGPSSFYSSN